MQIYKTIETLLENTFSLKVPCEYENITKFLHQTSIHQYFIYKSNSFFYTIEKKLLSFPHCLTFLQADLCFDR